jgi:dolichol-phosphate mannosyltransferase
MATAPSLDLSVIIPVYRCAGCLEELHARLVTAISTFTESFEIIMVDDASPDDAWAVMTALAAKDPRVKAVKLSRNFGQHPAFTAGLAEARGPRAATMDGDLQDPPEDLPRLWAKAEEGYEVVFAKRRKKQTSWRRQQISRLYHGLMSRFAPFPVDLDYGSLTLVDRPVLDSYLAMDNHGQHYMFVLHWLGFKATHIEYDQAERGDGGQSSYTLGTLLRFAIEGLFLQSTKLLYWIVYCGVAIATLGFLAALGMVIRYFTTAILPGWTSLIVLILTVGGLLMVGIGILAIYIGRIFEKVQGRPHYVVARRIMQAPPT